MNIKIVSVIIVVLIAVGVLGVYMMSYKPVPVTLYISDYEVTVGKTFSVQVNVSDVDGLFGYSVQLDYDTAILDALNITVRPVWSNYLPLFSSINETRGQIHVVVGSTAESFTGSVVLFEIEFKAVKVGITHLGINTKSQLADMDGKILEYKTETGIVTVKERGF